MKKLSIRAKITLWFSAALILVVGITYFMVLSVGNRMIQKTIRDNLVETVENNVDEVEFFNSIVDIDLTNDVDYYFPYAGGYLEIDDDFLDEVNQVYTSLCSSDGTLVYGENPVILETKAQKFLDMEIQTVRVSGTIYYIFDRELKREGLTGLWLRGVVSETQGAIQIQSVAKISLLLLPAIVLIAIIGGYLIARRTLSPIKQIAESAASINKGEDLKKRIEIGTGEDELHQLAACFNEMLERLDSAFQRERQFTSDASHELRTPMSVIMAQCELVLEKECSASEYEEAITVIRRQGGKMTKLIRDMLDISRLVLKGEQYSVSAFDLSELVRSICFDMALMKENGIVLECEIEENVFFHGNPELMSRLLTNLISNAYRYGRQNGHIHVSLSNENRGICLSVRDDGIGIAKEEQQKIFRRFYQVDCSRSSSGSGLGLSMAQEIAKFHGGEIFPESEPNQGSIFICVFPR